MFSYKFVQSKKLSLLLLMFLKVFSKISVSFERFQSLETSDNAMVKYKKVNIAVTYIFSFCQSYSPLLKSFEKWTFWFKTFETKQQRGNWNSRETLLLTQVQLMMFICVIEKCSGVCLLKLFFSSVADAMK